MATWERRGRQLVEDLKATTDNDKIEELAKAVIADILETYKDNLKSAKNPLTIVRKAVSIAFPDTEQQQNDNQYFNDSGKGKIARYTHIIFKHLTFSKEVWDIINPARKEYVQPSDLISPTEEAIELPQTPQVDATQYMINIQDIDTEILPEINKAANKMNISVKDFILKAAKDTAKTINKKTEVYDAVDLTSFTTRELLTSRSHRTHPKRIEELTKRAVRAIQIHNDNATELSQKYFISATAINALTGSRTMAISKILESMNGAIADHHAKHGLSPLSNRINNRDIIQAIDLMELVPDGVD